MQTTVKKAGNGASTDGDLPLPTLTPPVEFQLTELRGRLARQTERAVKEYHRGGIVGDSTLAALVVAQTELAAFERVRAIALAVAEFAPSPAVRS